MGGDSDVVDKLKTGYQAIGRTYKNHIDGYNLLPYLTGQSKGSPRKFFMYLSDDGDVLGMRYDNWKVAFMEQRCQGTLLIWGEPFTRLRIPKIYNLRTDPFERADETSNSYWESHDSPHLSYRSKYVCEERLPLQHLGETLHERAEPVVTHRWNKVVEHATLAEQRMHTAFRRAGFEHPIIA
jgi:hypothetical protein